MRTGKTYRWLVVIEGTLDYTNFAGYKTKKEAEYIADAMTKFTKKKHIVIDAAKGEAHEN